MKKVDSKHPSIPPYSLGPADFIEFLPGVSSPAKVRFHDGLWAIHYPGDRVQSHRLASELVGYRVAKLLDVRVPQLEVVPIPRSFTPTGTGRTIDAGFGTASRWIDGASYPKLDKPPDWNDSSQSAFPPEPFWRFNPYAELAAAIVVLDTWIMNFDRRKEGNLAIQGDPESPHVFCLDFDRAFTTKLSYGGRHYHWSSDVFPREELYSREALSVFGEPRVCGDVSTTGRTALKRLASLSEQELRSVFNEVPLSWGISPRAIDLWHSRLIERRAILLEWRFK